MSVEGEDVFGSFGEDLLVPSATLRRCNGQDITRRGGKGKSRIMLVLPTQLAFLKGTEGTVGRIEKINTESPEFVVSTSDGMLVFKGRFEESNSLCYLGIDLMPKKMQSVCTDVVTRVLVFDTPTLVMDKENCGMSPPVPISRGASVQSAVSEDVLLTQDTTIASQEDGGQKNQEESWQIYHGCSALARQHETEAAATLKRGSSQVSRAGDGDDDNTMDIDIEDLSSESGSEYGGVEKASSTKKKSGSARVLQQPAAEVITIENSASEDESSCTPRRTSCSRAARKAISYNVDDVPSDDGIDEDDLVAEVPPKKKPPAKSAAKTKTPLKSDRGAEKKSASKPTKAKEPISSATAKPKPKAAAKPNSAKRAASKDAFDFESSDEAYSEGLDEDDTPLSALKRPSTSRPARSSAKKAKTYHIPSGSSDEAEME